MKRFIIAVVFILSIFTSTASANANISSQGASCIARDTNGSIINTVSANTNFNLWGSGVPSNTTIVIDFSTSLSGINFQPEPGLNKNTIYYGEAVVSDSNGNFIKQSFSPFVGLNRIYLYVFNPTGNYKNKDILGYCDINIT